MIMTNMPDNESLLTVKQVIEKAKEQKFLIPHFQRGYRWREKNILDFLNDINGIDLEDEHSKICIQRVVVSNYRVIDGQQRLSTIRLILEYFKNDEKYDQEPNFINFENHDEISKFFREQVSKTIREYFEQPNANQEKFINKLLDHTYIIWDDVSITGTEETSAHREKDVEIFSRVNNRIPMSASDLFKAELLKNRENSLSDESKRTEVAVEWSKVESTLQDDRFWFMFSPPDFNENEARISILFRVAFGELYVSEDVLFEKIRADRELSISNDSMNNDFEAILSQWKTVLNLFYTMQHWYDNTELYHLVSLYFIFNEENNRAKLLAELYKEWNDNNMRSIDDFTRTLKNKVENYVHNIKEKIENLDYGKSNDRKSIKQILLLHNVITVMERNVHMSNKCIESKILKSRGERFPFHLYKKVSQWNLEHIASQGGDNFEDKEQVISYVDSIAKSIPDDFSASNDPYLKTDFVELRNDVNTELEKYKKLNKENLIESFKQFYKKHKGILDADLEKPNSISNLVLLDQHTNKHYKNAIFQYKRRCIIEADAGAHGDHPGMCDYCFILPCTRDVFSKYYTKKPESHHFVQWTQEDAESYLEDIKGKLNSFFAK